MIAEIWIAIIGAIAAMGAAGLANRGRQHAKATRAQVENSHTENFREETDTRHLEIMDMLRLFQSNQIGIQSDIRGIRKDLGRHTDQIRDLEKTQPRRRK